MKKYLTKKTAIISASIAVALVAVIMAIQFWPQNNQEIIPDPPATTVTNGQVVQGTNGYDTEPFSIAQSALGQIVISAINYTAEGIERNTAFLVSSLTQTLTQEHLYNYLSSPSGNGFSLEPQPNGEFLLHFDEEMQSAQIYNFIYSPPGFQPTSHAFQTMDIFRVTSTTPANSTRGIPIDAGIEVTFSQAISEEDFQNAFVINPPTEGRFLRRGNTYIFAPNTLEFNTTYTITIRQGLTSERGEVLNEDYIFAFSTTWGTAEGAGFFIAGSAYETFLPQNEIFIDIGVSAFFNHRNFDVSLYNLQTPENFVNFDTPGEFMETINVDLTSFPANHREYHYLFLGRTLPEGYYLAKVTSPHDRSGIVAKKFIQVSAISVYSLAIDGETIFWIHNATTNQPARGATIQVGNNTAVTDPNGIAIINTTQSSNAVILINYGNFNTFAYTKRTFAPVELIGTRRFLTYMQTDRPSYRPNDSVDVFGVIKPLYGQSILETDRFTISIGDIIEKPIVLDDFYAFNISVPVTGMMGHMEIMVRANGERLMSTWVEFFDYTNLSFVIEGSIDRNAYFLGDNIEAEIFVTNFAGLPIEGVTLQRGTEERLTTNSAGIATGTLAAGDSWMRVRGRWQPYIASAWFSAVGDVQGSQTIIIPFIIAPRDIMMEHERVGSTLNISTYNLTLDRVNNATSLAGLISDMDNFRGSAVDIDFTVEITRSVTTQTLVSQHYDHINRRTINRYNFETTRYLYRTIHDSTTNGRATITNLPTSENPLIQYSMNILYNDTRGFETAVHVTQERWFNHLTESSIRHFGFNIESRVTDISESFWDIRHRDLRINQQTNVFLSEDYQPIDFWNPFGMGNASATIPTTGSILVVMARDGILQTAVGSPMGTPITFPEAAISNALIFGAYFDNGYIFPIPNPITIHYDYTERAFNLELDFDAAKYSPGDEVSVTIRTTDSNGNPKPARVTLSVVDESSILGHEHNANFLSRLYRSSMINRWDFNFQQFASHTQHNFGGGGDGAEGGGGGDGGADGTFRDRFIDNPVFEVVETDASGYATLTFTLPHQITSWRVTAFGLCKNGNAADARQNIISSLPFFVDLILTNEFIAGDDIAAVAQVFPALSTNFTFEVLKDNHVIQTESVTSPRRAVASFGKLDVGSYTMRVQGISGNYSDTIVLPFDVVDTGMIIPVRLNYQISVDSYGLPQLNKRQLPVHVSLSNGNIGPLSRIMFESLSGSAFRTDIIAARYFFDRFMGFETTETPVQYRVHTGSGGIAELTYEYADLFYTARFAASFPEFVNNGHILRYLLSDAVDATNPKHRAASLLAMAAISQPVLLNVLEEIDNLGEIQTMEQELTLLYLASALIAMGDDTGAYHLINAHQAISHENQQHREAVETALLFINTQINPHIAWEMLSIENEYVSNIPERINFVRHAVFMGESISEFEIFINGEVQSIVLENFERKELILTTEQFENLNITPISGVTNINIMFYAADTSNWQQEANQISIRRNIIPFGDLYRFDIDVELPVGFTGSLTIYDRLPSNKRFVPITAQRTTGSWFSVQNTQRQLVEINTFHRFMRHGTNRQFSYFAMKLFDGDMADDITIITNRDANNHIWGASR